MGVGRIGTPIDIAISGLRIEAMRLKVISENIANAQTAGTKTSDPYRRKEVVIETRGGVKVPTIMADLTSAFKMISKPGHPNADENGMVRMPNVDLPVELIDMVIASRAYQANAAMMKRYQDSVNAALELLR